jgi:PAS domain S-box-containing protein
MNDRYPARWKAADVLSPDGSSDVFGVLRSLLTKSPLPTWICDAETLKFLAVNDAAIAQYGYSRDEFLAMRITDIRPAEDVPQLLAGIIGRDPGTYTGEWRHRRKNGQMFDVAITSQPFEYRGRRETLIVAQDITDRKRTIQLQAQLAAIVESSHDAIFSTTEDGTIRTWNAAAERLFGYACADIIGRPESVLVPPDRLDEVPMVLERLSRGGRIDDYETVVLTRNGTRLDVSLTISPITAADGRVAGISTIARDISERKKIERRLRENEERLNLALRAGQIGIWEWDIRSDVFTWGETASARYGLPPGTGPHNRETFLKLVHPEDRDRVALEADAAVEHGTTLDTEFRVVWPDRSIHVIAAQARLHRDEADRPARLLGVGSDISRRWTAEQEARESAERYRSLMEGVPVGVYRRTADGRYLEANEALVRMFRFPDREAFMNVNAADLYLDPSEMNQVMALLERDGVATFETKDRRYDGSVICTRTNSRAIKDITGRITAVEGIVEDIDAQTRMAEEERKARDAEAANLAKSEFLSRMSHELRTPLNAILGFSQLLDMDDALTAEQRENVGDILHAGRFLLELINEILDISRVDSERLHLSLEPVAVWEAVQETLRLIDPAAARAGVALAFEEAGSAGKCIAADQQRLKQVLLNLLTNAVKYNHRGGTVTITCTDVPGARLRINIHDTGPGIPSEKIHRLFSPFDRLDAEQTGVEGTGLGLTLSKRLVEAMGGLVGVESIPGEGSTFWVEFARVEEPLREAKRQDAILLSPAVATASHQTRTILSIEDNMSNLKLIQHLLARRQSVKLIAAMQGQLGLELAREHHPDLILLDLHLPDLSGDVVLQRLLDMPETRETPVIMLSADASSGQMQRLLGMGAADYLTKPIDVKKFMEILTKTLGKT